MDREFERALAYHGGPALAGIKAANLISFAFARYPALPQLLTEYGAALGQRDICLDPLACCKERCLLLVYRRAVLWRHLSSPQILAILLQTGYQVDGPPETLLAQLRRRLADGQGFPHEIGAFLGYPPQDVKGFLQHGGKEYKCCGQWKVYGDVAQAQACFARYDHCRRCLCRRLAGGNSLLELFCPLSCN